jgi:hypothetical protein
MVLLVTVLWVKINRCIYVYFNIALILITVSGKLGRNHSGISVDATLSFVSDEFPAPEMNNQNRIGVGCRGGELGSNPGTNSIWRIQRYLSTKIGATELCCLTAEYG